MSVLYGAQVVMSVRCGNTLTYTGDALCYANCQQAEARSTSLMESMKQPATFSTSLPVY